MKYLGEIGKIEMKYLVRDFYGDLYVFFLL